MILFHLPIFLTIGKISIKKPGPKYARIHNESNTNKFITEINDLQFNHILEIQDTDQAYQEFITPYCEVYERCFPLKKISNARRKDKKWITKGLRISSQHKNKLLRKKIKNPSVTNIEKYKSYCKVWDKIWYHAENEYYLNAIHNKRESNKAFWELYSSILNPSKVKSKTLISKVTYSGKTMLDPPEISNAFNDHFVTIGKKLTDRFPIHTDFKKYMKRNCNETIFLAPIVIPEIEKEIGKLKDRKSPGPDNIPPKIVKLTKDKITPVLCHIFNLSITQGTYPELLKISKVIALHKKGDKCNPDNYRPISLLNIFNKVFEKLLYHRFIDFFNRQKLIFKYQFGFRENHSTVLALTEIVDKIKETVDKNGFTVGIFLDLKKAFDAVDHKILLEKLKYFGIRGTAHDLMRSYLSNRKQFTVINDIKSHTKPIECGVPQGSVLGPLLFLVFINDMEFCIPENLPRLFADDTGLFVHGQNINRVLSTSQEIITKLEEWFTYNKLTLSITKCSYIIFKGPKKKLPQQLPHLTINGHEIEKVEHAKYIGVTLDSSLTFKHHVENICNKISSYFRIFYYLRDKVPMNYARQIYYATVYPHINYCLEIYGGCNDTVLKKLQTKQNGLMKVLTKKEYRYPTNALHHENKILKVKHIYELKLLSFVHDCLNAKSIEVFDNYFKKQSQTHDHDLRDKNKLVPHTSTSNLGCSSVKSNANTFWNNNQIARDNVGYSKTTLKKKLIESFNLSYE